MNIDQRFKDSMKILRDDIKIAFELQDIDSLPNTEIITRLRNIYETQPNIYVDILTETGESYNIWDLFQPWIIKAICDRYIRTKTWQLFVRAGMAEGINNNNSTPSQEAELFEPWKITRFMTRWTLRNIGFDSNYDIINITSHMGNHYKVLGYDIHVVDEDKQDDIVTVYKWSKSVKLVYVEDAYGAVYLMPQTMLAPTTITDIKEHMKQKEIKAIIDRLQDSAKYDLAKLTDEYQSALRNFMDASKLLAEKQNSNHMDEALRIYDIQMNIVSMLKKNEQIANVEYIPKEKLVITTVPLFNNELPIGKYGININLRSREVKIRNLDIQTSSEFQHPHVARSWDPCLGERANPLRLAYEQTDYISLVRWFIAYLEDLNESSVYIWMGEFQSLHRNKFKYQLNKQKPLIEEPIPDVIQDITIGSDILINTDYIYGDIEYREWIIWTVKEIHTSDEYWLRCKTEIPGYPDIIIPVTFLSLRQSNNG